MNEAFRRLRAIIVDDEENGRMNLLQMLEVHCPEIEVVGMAESAEDARLLVVAQRPDVVFLDIAMPEESGFDFLESYAEREFSVVFVTAYNQHALQAIKNSAVDYLLKPIAPHELRQTVLKLLRLHSDDRVAEERSSRDTTEQFRLLMDNLRSGGKHQRILVPQTRGFRIIEVADILYLQAERNYTCIFLENGDEIIATTSLKEFDDNLSTEMFCRIHKSNLVNMNHVLEFHNHNGGYVVLRNKQKLPVSFRRTKHFVERIQSFVHGGDGAEACD